MGDFLTVVVVDDHAFFRDGVVRGLSSSGRVKVLGEAASGRDGLTLIKRERPDVAVVDYQMPGFDGLAVLHAVVRDQVATKVLLLSAVTDSALVFQALEEGASGYISKEAGRREVVEAVLAVGAGRTVVPPDLTGGLVEQIRLRREVAGPVLTDREVQVLRSFAQGLSVPDVAAELFLGVSTVKTHTQHLYQKLGVSDRAAAVAEAMRRGLLE